MMGRFVRCIDCGSKISVDDIDWNAASKIHLVCEKCNRRNTYEWNNRRTSAIKILTIRYQIYKNKLYSDRKITTIRRYAYSPVIFNPGQHG